MTAKIAKFSTLTGVIGVVLVFVSFGVEGDTPDLDASASEVTSFYADKSTEVVTASVLATLAAVAFVFFGASIRRAIRRRERGAGVLSVVAFGGGLVVAAGLATDSAIRFALGESAGEIDPVALQGLFAFWENFFWPMSAGLATLVLATSLSAFETRIVPIWLASIGLLVAVALFSPWGEIALIPLAVWILILTFFLWRGESEAAASEDRATG